MIVSQHIQLCLVLVAVGSQLLKRRPCCSYRNSHQLLIIIIFLNLDRSSRGGRQKLILEIIINIIKMQLLKIVVEKYSFL